MLSPSHSCPSCQVFCLSAEDDHWFSLPVPTVCQLQHVPSKQQVARLCLALPHGLAKLSVVSVLHVAIVSLI